MGRKRISAALLGIALAAPALAQQWVDQRAEPSAIATHDWIAVGDEELAKQRGGFELAGGMLVSLDIERLVSINGTVVSNSRFVADDMTKLSASQVQAAQAVMAGMLVQNAASDRLIRGSTTINASVNTLPLLTAINFETSLRDVLGAAAGPR